MSTTAVGYRPRPLSFFEACRALFDRVSTLIELNRSGLRALRSLARAPAQLMQLQIRIYAVTTQLIYLPLRIAQYSLQLLSLLQCFFAPICSASQSSHSIIHRLSITASMSNVTLIMQSITNALQGPLKLIALPIAIFEAPFRLPNRQTIKTGPPASRS